LSDLPVTARHTEKARLGCIADNMVATERSLQGNVIEGHDALGISCRAVKVGGIAVTFGDVGAVAFHCAVGSTGRVAGCDNVNDLTIVQPSVRRDSDGLANASEGR